MGDFDNRELPEASGGVEPYMYSFTCAGGSLPSGMGFAPATRVFAGTPDAPFRDSCTYTVTDSAQPAATVSVAVEVEVTSAATDPLTLPDTTVPTLRVGAFHSAALPEAEDGVRPYMYSFTCAGGSLPSGMGFAPATRVFAGTPDAPFRDSCTYTVTDSAQPAATVSVAVEVEVTSAATDPLTLPDTTVPTLRVGAFHSAALPEAEHGVRPYMYSFTCAGGSLPSGMGFAPATRVFAGTPDAPFRDSCTYTVTDSALTPGTVSVAVEVEVEPLDRGIWRFRTRNVSQSDHPLDPMDTSTQQFVTLPFAIGGPEADQGDLVYKLLDVQDPLDFDPARRVLSYTQGTTDPLFDTPTTFRYEVYEDSADTMADDTLCVDISYRDPPPREERPSDGRLSTVRVTVRDDVFFDVMESEYRCPDASPTSSSFSRAAPSNPVHTALAPVHARRALEVAHGAVLDRVHGWSRGESSGDAHLVSAFAPTVGVGSVSGWSDGFDYSGSSESLSAGAELGAGVWQAGLVGSFTRTELHYRAEAGLAEHGYVAGEHHTEVLSLHPFVAWHAPSGGHVRASMGAGTGELRHRDDHGFPSWSRSDVHLQSWTAGASVPVADVLTGELQVEAGIESFSFDIEGGGRISSSLPTLRGRDWRAGLAWSAPVPGAPSLSVAWRRLTGDGPEGGRLEARGSVSVEGVFDPRLALLANAEGSFGLGDLDHDSWGLAGGVRFAPDASRRGFGLELDTRLAPLEEGGSAGVGIRAEAGYGLWGGPLFGTLRPHVGLIRHPGGGFLRRSVGVDLRDTPYSRARIEVHDHAHDRAPALRFTLRQRF